MFGSEEAFLTKAQTGHSHPDADGAGDQLGLWAGWQPDGGVRV